MANYIEIEGLSAVGDYIVNSRLVTKTVDFNVDMSSKFKVVFSDISFLGEIGSQITYIWQARDSVGLKIQGISNSPLTPPIVWNPEYTPPISSLVIIRSYQ